MTLLTDSIHAKKDLELARAALKESMECYRFWRGELAQANKYKFDAIKRLAFSEMNRIRPQLKRHIKVTKKALAEHKRCRRDIETMNLLIDNVEHMTFKKFAA